MISRFVVHFLVLSVPDVPEFEIYSVIIATAMNSYLPISVLQEIFVPIAMACRDGQRCVTQEVEELLFRKLEELRECNLAHFISDDLSFH